MTTIIWLAVCLLVVLIGAYLIKEDDYDNSGSGGMFK